MNPRGVRAILVLIVRGRTGQCGNAKAYFQNRYFGLAMESRQTAAHGATVLIAVHINLGINPVFGVDVRPHPGPVPQRENPFPPLSKPSVWMAEYCANVNNNCHI
jgi:hypothetical protein